MVNDSVVSKETAVTSEVPQGSILWLLLFLIYINDLPNCTSSSTAQLFADDTVIYHRIESQEDCSHLQDDLDALQDWEATWLMEFNPSKCQLLRVTNKRNPIIAQYSIHCQISECVESAKYLGVSIDIKLNFNSHVNAITKKANSAWGFLSQNLRKCSRKIKSASYTTYVCPTVKYVSAAWDAHTQRNTKMLEQTQCNAAWYVTRDYEHTSSVKTMLQELKWPTLEEWRKQSRLAMMYQIMNHLVDICWHSYVTTAQSSTHGKGFHLLQLHCSSKVYHSGSVKWIIFRLENHEISSFDLVLST